MRFPSGDQTGAPSPLFPSPTSLWEPAPSDCMTQISESSVAPPRYAIWDPSGETAGYLPWADRLSGAPPITEISHMLADSLGPATPTITTCAPSGNQAAGFASNPL